ncbi:putative cleft lip and palate transmembrane protein 1-like [Apostichopus japonicus]|uniref:Putative cleft lip and palate transmembrane protein 1-like n=1 Tax=Stichopus japonicus TaxID=307972 RepID=A0A2G8JE68_STIJA|nr:putative cleft lip and palate transmembrane protein 1-like [Apostichopus japonicus]
MASTEASQIVVPDDGNGAVEQPNQDGTAQPQQQPQQTVWQTLKSVAFRIFVFYMIMNLFKRGTSPTTEPGKEGEAPANVKVGVNLFDKGTLLDMKVFISEEEFFSDFTNPDKLFWEYDNLEYGDWTSGPNGDGSVTYTDVIPATEAMMNNGSIYAHVYFTKVNYSPDPSKKGKYSKKYTFSITKQLNKFKKRKYLKTKNLLTGETDASPDLIKSAETEGPVQILSHWHPNLTIALVDDHTPFREGSVPQPLDKLMTFYNGDYYPIIFVNDYWNLNSDYMPINQTTPELTLELTFTPMSLMKLQFYAAQTMKNQWSTLLGEAGGQGDDEEEDGLKFDRNEMLFGFIPKLTFTDKESYTASATKEYDMQAFKYLSWLLYPLLGCYAVYALLYQEHKGWFIMMTPQLFINTKLKSVAQSAMEMLTYKALNLH